MFRQTFRDPRLPKTYPGCWQSKRFRAKYDRIYMRIMREGPYGNDERKRQSATREVVRKIFPKKCFDCGRQARRYAVRRVIVKGKEVWGMLRWCGKCQ